MTVARARPRPAAKRSRTGQRERPGIRTRLIEAATRVFVERGYLQTSVEDILRAAKVSRASFYTHFDNKVGLLEALVNEHLDRRAYRFRELVDLDCRDIETMTRWFTGLGLASRDQPGLIALFRLAVALEPKLMRSFAAGRDLYADILGSSFPGLDRHSGPTRLREKRRVTAHFFIMQVEQYVASMADGSWVLDVETTARRLAEQLADYAQCPTDEA